jgi:non-ribosomal peptide synthetase component E (peptide arylation enzyme)
VIRGENVTTGYVANPEANASAFTDGWFRTGDEGHVDADGYLVLSGRIKELINRGGEKIAPREIDEVLLDHPAVSQAVAFAVPHARLGEEVAAVVVLADGADVTERQIQEWVGVRLAPFKVPRAVVFASSIPKGPTGKLQRIGLAERLGVAFEDAAPVIADDSAPRTAVEEVVASMWEDVLGLDTLGVNERFVDVGGDSILATRLIARVRQMLDIELSIIDFFEAATVADQARLIEAVLLGEGAGHSPHVFP